MHDIHASSNPKYSSAYREIPRVYSEGSCARGGRHNAIRDKFSRCIAAWGSLVSSQNGGGIKKQARAFTLLLDEASPGDHLQPSFRTSHFPIKQVYLT